MSERVMKAAIEYIANEYSANMQMLECNPRTAITIAECQRLMVGFSAQQSRIKEQTKRTSIEFVEYIRDRAWEHEYRDQKSYSLDEHYDIFANEKRNEGIFYDYDKF